jgi:hypothetical protein
MPAQDSTTSIKDAIKAFLQQQRDSDKTMLLLGAAGGLGTGALMTRERPGETARQRGLRTIRNAAVSGALGGVGLHALGQGVGDQAEVLRELAGAGANQRTGGESESGFRQFLRSPAAAATGLVAGGAFNQVGHKRRTVGAFEQLFGKLMAKGPGPVRVETVPGTPRSHGGPAVAPKYVNLLNNYDYKSSVGDRYAKIQSMREQMRASGSAVYTKLVDQLQATSGTSSEAVKAQLRQFGVGPNANYYPFRRLGGRLLLPGTRYSSHGRTKGFGLARGLGIPAAAGLAPLTVDWILRKREGLGGGLVDDIRGGIPSAAEVIGGGVAPAPAAPPAEGRLQSAMDWFTRPWSKPSFRPPEAALPPSLAPYEDLLAPEVAEALKTQRH